ncbi:hypothetical protein J2S98_001040 [Arthrobacter oryzae]|uniref:hypothetical protein n=1 Tax=Arthrobacter TaxID=1663 RepID=UPI001F24CC1E|nr:MULTISPECIES: hypothetical protein [Arthrobacter]MDP9985895.1 hypothetical protein [Arthrobacter oryzae]UKA71296.1 hypothetical protein LFT49_00620 [Arthrobacter sp. FW306-06-A]
MKSESTAWAFLRPLLLAVAATAAWIALSAAGASADSSPSRDLLPGVLDSAAANLTHQGKDAPEPVMAGPDGGKATATASTVASLVPAPSLRPAAEEVSGLAEDVVQSVPAANELVPSGTVAAVVDPAVVAVDGIVDGTVGAAVPLAVTVLAPLDPVLEPALEPVIDAMPLPIAAPEAEPVAVLPVTTDVAAAPAPEPAPASPPAAELPQTTGGVTGPAQSPGLLQSTSPESRVQMKLAAVTPVLFKAGPEDEPFRTPWDVPPAVPSAATSGSSLSGGNDPAASGWTSSPHFPAPAAGTSAIGGPLLTAPSPVSFDPGSSPD